MAGSLQEFVRSVGHLRSAREEVLHLRDRLLELQEESQNIGVEVLEVSKRLFHGKEVRSNIRSVYLVLLKLQSITRMGNKVFLPCELPFLLLCVVFVCHVEAHGGCCCGCLPFAHFLSTHGRDAGYDVAGAGGPCLRGR